MEFLTTTTAQNIENKLNQKNVNFEIIFNEDTFSASLFLYWNEKSFVKYHIFDDMIMFEYSLNQISGIKSKDINTKIHSDKKLNKLLK
jgi:hypothetical protein